MATPLATIERVSDAQAISEILAVIEREGVERLVVGEPRRLDGSRGPAAERVGSFCRKLTKASGVAVSMVDEALTTREASWRMEEIGTNRRHLDALAAQIILQEDLDRRAAGSQADPAADRSGCEE